MFRRWCFFMSQWGYLPVNWSWNSITDTRTRELPRPDTAVRRETPVVISIPVEVSRVKMPGALCSGRPGLTFQPCCALNHERLGSFDFIFPISGSSSVKTATETYSQRCCEVNQPTHGEVSVWHLEHRTHSVLRLVLFGKMCFTIDHSEQAAPTEQISPQTCFILLNAVFKIIKYPVCHRPHHSLLCHAAYLMH